MKIPCVVHREFMDWNKDGKFWFTSVREFHSYLDTETGKYDYETWEEFKQRCK